MRLDPTATALKAEFKARIARVDRLITPAQRADIVREAQLVFASVKAVVLEMTAVATPAAAGQEVFEGSWGLVAGSENLVVGGRRRKGRRRRRC